MISRVYDFIFYSLKTLFLDFTRRAHVLIVEMNYIGDRKKIFGYKVLKLPLRFTQILLIEEYYQCH